MFPSRRRLSSFCLLSLCGSAALNLCAAQTSDVLCRGGSGKFGAAFHRDVQVQVGAAKSGGLATRSCEASLSSGGQEITVASEAWEVDLDAFGVDLGLGAPVRRVSGQEIRVRVLHGLPDLFTADAAALAADSDWRKLVPGFRHGSRYSG